MDADRVYEQACGNMAKSKNNSIVRRNMGHEHIAGGDSYLVVEGRAKDQINRGGEKVPAEEVEQLLMTHPHVMDVALVAMPDRHLGEKSCAFVIRRDSALRAADLTRFVREAGVAAFKVPDRVEFVDNFPKTPVGKIDKKVLRQRTGHLTQRIDLTPHH